MKRIINTGCLGLFLLASFTVSAAEVVSVDSMNYPAWVDRGERSLALFPGQKLQSEDQVRTGSGGRVLLRFSDGSAVKLGESASFNIESAERNETAGLLEASFRVLKGAFRFTSSFFRSATDGHQVNVNIGAITAGIRGTDIWGRSNSEKDLVCLIDGEIEVTAEGEPLVNMSQALSFYVKPKDQSALPVADVDADQLKQWAVETELDSSTGIASADGQWLLQLSSLTREDYVEVTQNRFTEKGFAVQKETVEIDGVTWFRLYLPGFVSSEAASNAKARIAAEFGINDSWAKRKN